MTWKNKFCDVYCVGLEVAVAVMRMIRGEKGGRTEFELRRILLYGSELECTIKEVIPAEKKAGK